MEDLFPAIVVIIGIIGSIISSAKKERNNQAAKDMHKAAAAARVEAAQKQQAEAAAQQATVLPPQVITNAPRPTVLVRPTVHPHLEPDCEIHDQPGSLGVTSLEGKDPCHEDELTMTRSIAQVPQQEGGITFDWTGTNMVKAFVMQEILTRPANRTPVWQRQTN